MFWTTDVLSVCQKSTGFGSMNLVLGKNSGFKRVGVNSSNKVFWKTVIIVFSGQVKQR